MHALVTLQIPKLQILKILKVAKFYKILLIFLRQIGFQIFVSLLKTKVTFYFVQVCKITLQDLQSYQGLRELAHYLKKILVFCLLRGPKNKGTIRYFMTLLLKTPGVTISKTRLRVSECM